MYPGSRDVDGQRISIANKYKELDVRLDSAPLKTRVEQAKASSNVFKYAVTFPGGTRSMDALLVSRWRHRSTKIFNQIYHHLRWWSIVGYMDAFCAGEPWNAQLLNEAGYSALTTGEIWQDHPEKAFTMRAG